MLDFVAHLQEVTLVCGQVLKQLPPEFFRKGVWGIGGTDIALAEAVAAPALGEVNDRGAQAPVHRGAELVCHISADCAQVTGMVGHTLEFCRQCSGPENIIARNRTAKGFPKS